MKTLLYALLFLISALLFPLAYDCSALTFSLSPGTTVVGSASPVIIHTTTKEDSLVELARHYGIGFNEIEIANPGVDAFVPGENLEIRIPSLWVLPDAPMEGIVINTSEMRLYYFAPAKKGTPVKVSTFPIGIGDEGTETPAGTWKISEKRPNPSWYPPASIRKERPELPGVVPPGPENPSAPTPCACQKRTSWFTAPTGHTGSAVRSAMVAYGFIRNTYPIVQYGNNRNKGNDRQAADQGRCSQQAGIC